MHSRSFSSSASTDAASGIRVVIEPSQSAYFAGEPFSCTVTFSNTRTADSTLSSRSVSSFMPSHKRAAHSVSSAPLARPPTSPGIPKTAQPFLTRQDKGINEEDPVRRRGLVGKPPSAGALEITRRAPTRSLSVDISPQDLYKRFTESAPPSPYLQRSQTEKLAKATPLVSSPLARDHARTLPPSHPHARKASVIITEADISTQSLVTSPTLFQASLDPITENGAPEPPPKSPGSQSALGMGTPSTLSIPTASVMRSKSINSTPPRSAFATTFSPMSTELLLYAYAQLVGTLHIDPVSVSSSSELLGIRAALRKKAAIGGGSLDIGQDLDHARPGGSNGFFGFLSTPAPTSTTFSQNVSRAIEDVKDALPTLETQPSMLAIDLPLAPGESRSYSYTLDLPENLPPTFKGRAFRFSYELVVGICRATTPFTPSKQAERRRSRVMRVPIRVYNYVAVGKPPCPYDLLWPVARRRDKNAAGRIDEVKKEKGIVKPLKATGSMDSLRAYIKQVLTSEDGLEHAESEMISADSGSLSGCREAVEITTRNPKKISYDVNKDGEKVAELTFVKSAYRLGETVLGVVEINEEQCRSKVFKMSAVLETHESLPWSGETVRRVHAEHHSSFVIDTRRISFALDIPSDASPAFEIAKGVSEYAGGLEWKLRLYLLVSVGTTSSPPPNPKGKGRAVEVQGFIRDGPEGDWGQSWRATVPMERVPRVTTLPSPSQKGLSTWSAIFSPFAGGTYHDADEQDEDDNGDDELIEMGAETVECVVPLKVFPGNTAFRAMEVVFEV